MTQPIDDFMRLTPFRAEQFPELCAIAGLAHNCELLEFVRMMSHPVLCERATVDTRWNTFANTPREPPFFWGVLVAAIEDKYARPSWVKNRVLPFTYHCLIHNHAEYCTKTDNEHAKGVH
jgi:hypothetical protein